ncbi:A-kinase anchor protein 8-like [Callorhinchus milii]|nr:A-kinase anchor protein 8-like [Callorhinchus milii]
MDGGDGGYGDYGEDDSWNTETVDTQGYDGYDYSYTQDNISSSATNYGYNSGNKTWDPPKNPNTDTIVAKINQRLDMLSQFEDDTTQGRYSGQYSGQYNRFTPYESYDSRSSLNDQDLYRSGYGYSEYGPNYSDSYGGRYDHYDNSSYGSRKDQFQNRPYGNQRGQNWSRDWAPHKRPNWNDPYVQHASSRRMSAHWNELSMGGRGPNVASARNLPSLFSPNIIPMDLFRVQGSGRSLGGGRQRKKDKNRNKGKVPAGPGMKRKQSISSTEDPENKQAKTDDGEDSDAEEKEEDGAESGDGITGEDKESGEKKPKRFPTMQEKKKAGKFKKIRDRLAERITYACSVCKFRTFEDDEISNHMRSRFHKETLKFIGTKLTPQTADFLDEYIANKNKKTQKRREQIGDETILKKQLLQQQDMLQGMLRANGIGMEQCLKKVEAAHCMACDLFIPMQSGFIGQHLRTVEHNRYRKAAIERAKKGSLIVAKSILNNSNITEMLEKYIKGEKPFTDDPDDKDEDDTVAAHEGEGEGDGEAEGQGDGERDDLNESTNDEEKKEGETAAEGQTPEGETAEGEGNVNNAEDIADKSEKTDDVPDEEMDADGETLGEAEGNATEESKDPEDEPLAPDDEKILEEGGDEEGEPFDDAELE